jgi:CRP-like cAMP-binding protein
MDSLERILARHPFCKDMEPRYLQLLVSCAANVRFDAGQLILEQGEEANHFYLIRQGRVAVELHTPERGAITVQTVGEGDVLGWSWLSPPYQWRFDARAVTLTRALALDGTCLRTKCEEDHDLGYVLLKRFAQIITQRLEAARLQLLDVYGVHA